MHRKCYFELQTNTRKVVKTRTPNMIQSLAAYNEMVDSPVILIFAMRYNTVFLKYVYLQSTVQHPIRKDVIVHVRQNLYYLSGLPAIVTLYYLNYSTHETRVYLLPEHTLVPRILYCGPVHRQPSPLISQLQMFLKHH